MTDFSLGHDETKIGTWTVLYFSPGGVTYNGELMVTSKRLLYKVKSDVVSNEKAGKSLFVKSGTESYLVIPKAGIVKVDTKQSLIKKQIVITLSDGQIHTFDYGMLNIEQLAEAINQRG